jgi:DNA-binding transcriptional ArsR family regulator
MVGLVMIFGLVSLGHVIFSLTLFIINIKEINIDTLFSSMVLIFKIILVYFIPTIIAFYYKNPNKIDILLLNLFLGLTIIGWIIALGWSIINLEKYFDTIVNKRINKNNLTKSDNLDIKKEKNIKNKILEIIPFLNNNEQKILEIISLELESENFIWASKITEKTKIPKTTVNRIIKSLKEKKIIETSSEIGKVKKIYYHKNILK